MTSGRDYKSEALAARRAARSTLVSLREARLRAKQGRRRGTESKVVPMETSSSSSLSPDTLFDMSQSASAYENRPLETGPEHSSFPSDDAHAAGSALTDEPCPIDPQADTTGANDEDAARHRNRAEEQTIVPDEFFSPADSGTGDHAIQRSNAPRSEFESAARTETVAADSDLFNLPGAGAGVVWMFQRCGIHTLADLARADAAKLSAQLGVVGHILNIEPWIAHAKAEMGPRTPAD